jgi:hypothetical protein
MFPYTSSIANGALTAGRSENERGSLRASRAIPPWDCDIKLGGWHLGGILGTMEAPTTPAVSIVANTSTDVHGLSMAGVNRSCSMVKESPAWQWPF